MSEGGNLKNREPLAITTAVVAAVGGLINVAVLFGWNLTPEQVTAINTAVGLVAALVVVLVVRPKVTPVTDPQLNEGALAMSEHTTEFDDELIVDTDLNTEEPEVESTAVYGYVEPSTDVPPPPDVEQNPGITEGAHS